MIRLGYILCLTWLLGTGITSAETVMWSDDFESAATNRWASTSVWHIKAPTSGPATNNFGFRSHSGTNCASTQSYPQNQDSRLICTNYGDGATFLVLPSADQAPRLRFWHWFNLSSAIGFVEISTNFGVSWSQISPTYYNITGGGVWSSPVIDLTSFAGQSVQFAFRFYGSGSGNGLGWYIDDVSVIYGPEIVMPSPESFEFDPKFTDWAVDTGTWEIGKPTSGPGFAHSGTNCAATVLGGNYSPNVDSRLMSPPFIVPTNNPVLQFWHWYSFNDYTLGFLEVNSGNLVTNSFTNSSVTTTVSNSINTNIYQLFGAQNTNYSVPFYWNSAIGAWTNATKVMGNVSDPNFAGQHFFEAGNAPLATVGGPNVDYRGAANPVPQTANATNFSAWQGMTWNSPLNPQDNPVGYFGTNSTYTYVTNTSVTTSSSSWNQISATFQNGSTLGSWIKESIDLSSFAGQPIQIAFHFGSGSGTVAAGWYVDDIALLMAPTLTVPTNQVISFGQTVTNVLSATNSSAQNATYTFGLSSASTNVTVTGNGTVIWTNTSAPPGTYPVNVRVIDNSTPPYVVAGSFSVTVLPLPSQLVLTNASTITNGPKGITFSVKTPWTNSTWMVVTSTNLNTPVTNWIPIYTNQTGAGGTATFTDLLSTNFLRRYYRAVFP